MPIDPEAYQKFETLIKADVEQTELECSKYLHHAAALLVPRTPVRLSATREERNYFGATDFIVAATLLDDTNREANYVYIWELKAPQVYLFEPDDNKNRYRPTKEFSKAENQLLHYYLQAEGDSEFRKRFEVMDHKNIRLGGIIIGRSSDRMFKGDNLVENSRKAGVALSVRENYLYHSHGIRILTWDRVLEFVKPPT